MTTIAACSNDALDRRDKIELSSGNAPRANVTMQVDKVWPRNVNDTDIPINGARSVNVITNYNKGPIFLPQPTTSGVSTSSGAAGGS